MRIVGKADPFRSLPLATRQKPRESTMMLARLPLAKRAKRATCGQHSSHSDKLCSSTSFLSTSFKPDTVVPTSQPWAAPTLLFSTTALKAGPSGLLRNRASIQELRLKRHGRRNLRDLSRMVPWLTSTSTRTPTYTYHMETSAQSRCHPTPSRRL
jgi:hypothetical protein